MASTSRDATAHRKPDVFVSFRGEDTRNNFISHFSRAMERNGILAFTDAGLRGGDDISTTLANKISECRVAVVVFSPNYANSRWCLNELVHVIQSKQPNIQTVLPVFLQGVEPTHVRHQTGLFGDGFQGPSGQYPDKKDDWIHALKQTADLSSGVFSHSSEATIIDQLINGILRILGKMNSQEHDGVYFGKHRIEDVKSRLSSQGVSSIGIWGMGGSGKTTLARNVLAHISNNFDRECFLENVRERAKRGEFKRLKKDLFSQLLGPQHTIYDGHAGFILSRIPVLIVLDDVSDADQIEAVIGDWRNYDRGSKLIATSRDKQVLKNVCDVMHEVQTLDDKDSLLLLQHHIFRQRQPNSKQMELLHQIKQYAKGLPLALRLVGRKLYDKDITIWKSVLEKLSRNPDCGIMEIMRTSFDGLDNMEKSIFLDIACLLHCSSGDCAEIALKACGYCPVSILDRLIDKALLTVNQNNIIQMHDLLRQMGDEIGKHSRLWRWEETANMLSKDMGTSHKRKIEIISSELPVGKKIKLNRNVFKEMRKVRILRLRNNYAGNILMPEGLKYLPNALRYLEWKNYPLPSLPRHFDPENLVELHMRHSNLSRLWSGESFLPNLKWIDLCSSDNLLELPDLSGALKLEILEVNKCGKIKDIPHSVKVLVELKRLDLSQTGLTRCLELSRLEKLEHLVFYGCKKITELPQLPKNLIGLDLSYTKIKELPRGIEHLYQLKRLLCQDCVELESLPSNIGKLEHLEELVISGCSKLRGLPISFVDLHSLVKLIAHGGGLTCLPDKIGRLYNLEELDLPGCTNLESLPDGIGDLADLRVLNLSYCTDLESLPDGIEYLANLEKLSLSCCTKLESLPDGIEYLYKLKELDLSWCTNLESLPDGIEYLYKLEKLDLSNCANLESLPKDIGSCFGILNLSGWTNLESLPEAIKEIDILYYLYLSNCTNLERLPEKIKFFEYLTVLDLSNCTNLERLPEDMRFFESLTRLDVSNCTSLRIIPELPCQLEDLNASDCTSLVMYAPMSSPSPRYGSSFNFWNCTSLQEEARDQILKDFSLAVSELKNKSVPTSWWDEVLLVLPGSKLPAKWFNDSSIGEVGCSSLLVKTTQTRRSVADPMFALMFGVVFNMSITSFDSFQNELNVECRWQSKSGQVMTSTRLLSHDDSDPSWISAPREHIVLWLHLVPHSELCFPDTTFDFYVYGQGDGWRNDMEILEYGVTPINVSY